MNEAIRPARNAELGSSNEPFQNLHEFVRKARANLNQNAWDYIVGAAETETTMRRNRMALDELAFRPRVLRNVAKVDASVLHIPLPPVEVAVKEELPHFGAETQQMKILDQENMPHRVRLTIAAQAASHQTLILRENLPGLNVKTEGADLGPLKDSLRTVTVSFHPGKGYVTKTVEFAW